MRDLWLTIFQTSGTKLYTLFVGVFSLVLTARLLGPEGRGIIAAITAWVMLLASIAGLSLGQVVLNHLAKDQEHALFGKQLSVLLLCALFFSFLIGGVGVMAHLNLVKSPFGHLENSLLWLGFLMLPFLIWEQYGGSLLTGLGKLAIYNRYQMIGRTVAVVLIFLLVGWLTWGVAGVLISNLVGQIIVSLGGISFLYACAKKWSVVVKPDREVAKTLLTDGLKLHLNTIGVLLFTSVNILILNYYCSAEETGFYQMAYQFLMILAIVPQAAGVSVYHQLIRMGADHAWPLHRKMLIQVVSLVLFLGILAWWLAPWGILFLVGERFAPVVNLFHWMLWGVLGVSLSTLMASQWIVRGFFWQASMLTIGVGVLNLLCSLWLVPLHGVYGAVYTFLVTYGISFLTNGVMIWYCQKKYNLVGKK